MKCSHCAAQAKPRDMLRWELRLCADGRRKRVFKVCIPCDIALNGHMLAVMGDKDGAAKLERYAATFD